MFLASKPMFFIDGLAVLGRLGFLGPVYKAKNQS